MPGNVYAFRAAGKQGLTDLYWSRKPSSFAMRLNRHCGATDLAVSFRVRLRLELHEPLASVPSLSASPSLPTFSLDPVLNQLLAHKFSSLGQLLGSLTQDNEEFSDQAAYEWHHNAD